MSYHFDILLEVAEGAVDEMDKSFTSREFGHVLADSMQYLTPYDRYPRPLRRGAVAGQVLRRLCERGLADRTPRPGRWQPRRVSERLVRRSYDPLRGVWSSSARP